MLLEDLRLEQNEHLIIRLRRATREHLFRLKDDQAMEEGLSEVVELGWRRTTRAVQLHQLREVCPDKEEWGSVETEPRSGDGRGDEAKGMSRGGGCDDEGMLGGGEYLLKDTPSHRRVASLAVYSLAPRRRGPAIGRPTSQSKFLDAWLSAKLTLFLKYASVKAVKSNAAFNVPYYMFKNIYVSA
ncbi:hypothetical protein BpHYR1_043968 [Brachionus plicatilis]|uniref:Uncharacterized protein n=1 Tax=Brachionus plicatilis TaxID=10195 RepID=A0A3M7S162_BRAPC|nr:hypothetical protein BpHYR1_043968 [Brachionus plicatilis]